LKKKDAGARPPPELHCGRGDGNPNTAKAVEGSRKKRKLEMSIQWSSLKKTQKRDSASRRRKRIKDILKRARGNWKGGVAGTG